MAAVPNSPRFRRAVVSTVLIGAMFAAVGSVTAGASDAPGTEIVVVHAGDTLWSIASAAKPTADPRATIAEIKALNALPDSSIQAGQALVVPVG